MVDRSAAVGSGFRMDPLESWCEREMERERGELT
jgi:hypothetical protein